MIPFVIILCILLPLCLGSSWIIYDIIIIAILVWQLWYTYKKMKLEERTSNDVSTHLAAGLLRAETMAYGERQLGIDIKKEDT